MKKAVILFNLGGPDKLDNVEPFLFNLFNDPAILWNKLFRYSYLICFPREIKNYKEFCDIVKPDAIGIDYNIDPKKILKEIKIPIQGGLDPKILLTDKEKLKKEATKYLDVFKDHPYIFNLGHGVLPETNPNMFEYLVNTVKDY